MEGANEEGREVLRRGKDATGKGGHKWRDWVLGRGTKEEERGLKVVAEKKMVNEIGKDIRAEDTIEKDIVEVKGVLESRDLVQVRVLLRECMK